MSSGNILVDGQCYDLITADGDDWDAMRYDEEQKRFFATWYFMRDGRLNEVHQSVDLKEVIYATPTDRTESDR